MEAGHASGQGQKCAAALGGRAVEEGFKYGLVRAKVLHHDASSHCILRIDLWSGYWHGRPVHEAQTGNFLPEPVLRKGKDLRVGVETAVPLGRAVLALEQPVMVRLNDDRRWQVRCPNDLRT